MNASMRNDEPEVSEEIIRALANLNGLTILDEDLPEVVHRFQAMLNAARSIEKLDLEGFQPAPVITERAVRQ
jgi:Asp-tRNA(Asn)/Glu-tRNA(Gln) amidotransferase C subunit